MDDYESYIQAWKARLRGQDEERRTRAQRAWADAERMAQVLVRDFGAQAVYVFGSLLREGAFREDSDIDLAVAGLAPERYFSALAEIGNLTECAVDVVRLEQASEALRETVVREGRILYERSR